MIRVEGPAVRGSARTVGLMKLPGNLGLRHVALKVSDLTRSHGFYAELFGMEVVWHPDPGSLYLSSGQDNLALHQIPQDELGEYQPARGQFLDHVGIIVDSPEAVDQIFKDMEPRLAGHAGKVLKPPKRHRDDSYSFYVADPDGNAIQILYEPTLSKQERG